VLTITGLQKRFGSLTVLERFDLTVPQGGFTVLIGPSGCGKSTFFDLLTGVCPRDFGDIFWNNRPVPHLRDVAAYMQQRDLLLPWLSLLDNAILPARIDGHGLSASRGKAMGLFARMGLRGFEDHRPHAVSGGMRQRCALIRTLMFDRDLVLLDEPLSALDAITRRSLHGLLVLLQREFGKTLLMITHDIEEALLLGDVVVVLSRPPMRILARADLAGEKPREADDPSVLTEKQRLTRLLAQEQGPDAN